MVLSNQMTRSFSLMLSGVSDSLVVRGTLCSYGSLHELGALTFNDSFKDCGALIDDDYHWLATRVWCSLRL